MPESTVMTLRLLVRNEETALKLLREHDALPMTKYCPGKGQNVCNNLMRQRFKKTRKGNSTASWQCSKKNCHKELSIRFGNPFFYYSSAQGKCNAKLTLTSILELIWLFIYIRCTIREAASLTQHSSATVVEWWNNC